MPPPPDNAPNRNAGAGPLSAWFEDPDASVFLIAEIGQAHDGSLGTAHAYIDLVAQSGVDAVKFQTHIADAESTADEPWRVRFSPQDERRIDYWRRMEFSPEQWAGLKRHAEESGLVFLSSPFSLEAVELLEGLGIEGWKIASGELGNTPMLERIRTTGKPVLLSTGMSDLQEIDRVVDFFGGSEARRDAPGSGSPTKSNARRLAIFQCTSSYPCPFENIGLNLVEELGARYRCRAGLSDHSGSIYPILAGTARGMKLAEFHVTLSHHAFGPDVPASLEPSQLRQLVAGVRAIEIMLRNPVDKEHAAEGMAEMRRLFQRSLVAARRLPAGHRLQESDLVAKKPGTGLAPSTLPSLLGRRLRRPLEPDEALALEDVEPAPDARTEDAR